MFIEKVCATTWFIFSHENGPRLGVINYPGNHPTLNYHAILEGSTDLGHFASRDEAAQAIIKKETGVIVPYEPRRNG